MTPRAAILVSTTSTVRTKKFGVLGVPTHFAAMSAWRVERAVFLIPDAMLTLQTIANLIPLTKLFTVFDGTEDLA